MSQETIFPRDRVTVVGVLNVTPDSFSDGGRLVRDDYRPDVSASIDVAAALIEGGAHVLDVGGESTRPGAESIPAAQEVGRTQPVVEALAKRFDVPVSIDTRKSAVAHAALRSGARVVNDVSGLAHDDRMADIAASCGAEALILGHLRGTPETMQRAPHFEDPLREVAAELSAAARQAERAGVPRESLVADPGIGFGKRLEDNLQLIAHAGWLRETLSLPVLIGASRKSFLGTLTGDEVGGRDLASHAACAVAVFAGADAVRVHDVDGARRAVQVASALRAARRKELA